MLLNPQGRIQAELETDALPEKLLVLSHAALRERTVALLKKYVIASQVQIADLTDQMGSIAVEGLGAAGVVEETFGVTLEDSAEMCVRGFRSTAHRAGSSGDRTLERPGQKLSRGARR